MLFISDRPLVQHSREEDSSGFSVPPAHLPTKQTADYRSSVIHVRHALSLTNRYS
jgi:hypothetical protein